MQTLSQIRELFERYSRAYLFPESPRELYDPVNYIFGIGGKRLRPVLLLRSYGLFKEDVEKALPAALGIEVFHNFTLVHDDIMDEAPLRRGQPTVHTRYDLNTGILSGDVMLIIAYDCLSRVEDKTKIPEVFSIFNKVAMEVCEGQQRDMNFEKREEVSILEYLEMIRQKTAVLLAGAMKIGAILAGASKENAQHIYDFGENIGIAFQLQDDLLDSFGDPEKFGKKVGGDIVKNKKTYLLLKALELLDVPEREALNYLLKAENLDENEKIKRVKNVYKKLKIKELTNNLKNEYQAKAFQHLDAIETSEKAKKKLKDLAESLLKREI